MRPDWAQQAGAFAAGVGDAARRMQMLFDPAAQAEGVGYSPGDPDDPRPPVPAVQQMGADALAGLHAVPFEPARTPLVDPDLGFILEQDLRQNRRSNYVISAIFLRFL